jgi:hypothetical protein
MINKQFKDLNDGEIFTYNNIEYKKIAAVKVSCCRSINAEETQNSNAKLFIQPTIEVQVNDQL